MKDLALNELVKNGFNRPRVLVIGDCMLDIYLDGECKRLAPDVAVPVLDVQSVKHCLGGAGNVITNLVHMGADVKVVTVLGDDPSAQVIARELRRQHVDTSRVIYNSDCQTLTKTRLRRDQQCLLRYDIGKKYTLSDTLLKRYLNDVKAALETVDIVFISDYDKGNIPSELIQLLVEEQLRDRKVIVVDSKDYYRYRELRPDLIKPNYEEARKILGQEEEEDRVAQAMQWSESLCVISSARWVALTLDKDGVVLHKREQPSKHFPVTALKEGNFSGAGDTFLTALTLAYFNRVDEDSAIDLSIKAAQIGIQKSGTACCSNQELAEHLGQQEGKILTDLGALEMLCNRLRKDHKIVFTNGCFDIFHAGHAHYLGEAKSKGDILIVGINTDESIRRLKGSSRPVNKLTDRIEVLRALEAVDYIVPFGDNLSDNPIPILEIVKPHVFVKGEAYQHEPLPEEGLLHILGTQMVFVPHVHQQSTTKIIQRVQQNSDQVLKKIG
ncbi:PfkB family carbohydrate kinase [Sphingobacterium thalpophilum]|uniref:PfkB family carbohydrate kinase n=1 Tax=Sphingobacterium TaxID=28453 RepID=UPI002243E62D|nr:PfkB family carbohydrate kinase [Sphingobacterium sp. InxBP1]MCW8311873.1 adenylyltransferase/cytidyltransferase family protein [Sphingobacterium sp. InxBP1]